MEIIKKMSPQATLLISSAAALSTSHPPTEKNRPNLGNRRLNVPAVYIMPNCDIASMLLRFQGAPILTLIRLFRLCFDFNCLMD